MRSALSKASRIIAMSIQIIAVIEAAQLDEASAIRKCSDVLGTIGDGAFVSKYPVQQS